MSASRESGDGPFRPREFASIAGVTVRALHHYDRVGLLKPARTRAGHRAYRQPDLRRLKGILALKALGVPLKDIAVLLQARGADVGKALTARRAELVERKREIDGLIAVIDRVSKAVASGAKSDAAMLRRIIEVMDMDDEWAHIVRTTGAYRRSLPPGKVAELGRDYSAFIAEVQAAIDKSPDDPDVQALASRWVDLLRQLNGPDVSIERLIACGRETYAQLLAQSPRYASSPWNKAVALLTQAAMEGGQS